MQSHRCKSCDLAETVSAGKDVGFYTETRYCAKCATLVDVRTSLWCKDSLFGLLPPDRVDDMLELESKFGHCHHCETFTDVVWSFGEPCPKCGGEIEKTDDEIIDWD